MILSSWALAGQKLGEGVKIVSTKNGKGVYPSPKMISAAKNLLSELETADRSKDAAKFKKRFRLAKLNLRMRPAGTNPRGKTRNAGLHAVITCLLTGVESKEVVRSQISSEVEEDKFHPSEALNYRGKDDEGNPTDYAFAFFLSMTENDKHKPVLNVDFQENLVIEDQTGDTLVCEIPEKRGVFCEEPLVLDGKLIARLQCKM